jgi:Pyrimidine reductase, riboflavin biosynthesis
MEPIRTLIDLQGASPGQLLPDELRMLYGGDLRFPAFSGERPYVVGNFVSTLDGVISFGIPGQSGGGTISGSDEADRFIMGLLRASVDAIVVAAGTVHEVSPAHLWIAESIYPETKDLYAGYRRGVLQKAGHPLLVIVSGSGRLDLDRAIFRTPGTRVLIATTESGKHHLAGIGVKALDSTEVAALGDTGGIIDSTAILALLRDEFGVRIVLHEGGATLYGHFMAHGVVDEVFLTLAPQIAGRVKERPRPAMVAGVEFLPETAPWFDLVSAKQRGGHLYLRYRVKSGA